MLGDEDDIEEDADVTEAEFDRVAEDAAGPVLLEGGVEQELHEGEHAAGEVEQDLVDVPADGGASAMVRPDLRHELDHRYEKLDVPDGVDL